MEETAIFWTNKRGEQVHEDMVPLEEQLKTELVIDLTEEALDATAMLKNFKIEVVRKIEEYMEMMRDKYGLDPMKSSGKGNVTLQTFDGLRKVQVQVATHIDFDEKLTLAKEKLDEYFNLKTKDSDPEIRTLITKVFDVDKKGNVNAKQILSLKSYKITHPVWLEAMAIIDESIEIVGSKSYIRFYKREKIDDPWRAISIDFAAIGVEDE